MSTCAEPSDSYVLGLDLGVSSLGWSCLNVTTEQAFSIRCVGVRIFEAGVDGSIEQGKDSSRATVRREKRQPRRQIERRSRRQRKIFRILQRQGLMPDGPSTDQVQIDRLISDLDRTLRTQLLKPGDHIAAQVWPYKLRAMAMDQHLEPHVLGRALYHLAQRRGFLTNRKTDKDDEESGKVKAGIAELSRDMGNQTLGQYLASLDPDTVRIRQRWTARQMYEDEFEKIWTAQQTHHPKLLTPRFKRKLEQAIFKQRPLKSSKALIGRCQLEPDRRKAQLASPLAQRFRLLAAVNNLLIYEPDGKQRTLTADERTKLIQALERSGDLTFAMIRSKKLLDLKKTHKRKDKKTGKQVVTPGYAFNLEEGGEKKIPGDRTAAKLVPIFGDRWFDFSLRQQEQIVHDLLEYQNPDALATRAKDKWALTDEQANTFSKVRLEQGYARFSRRALQRLIPHMEEGLHYMTAQKDEYPESFEVQETHDLLPPVLDAIKDLRNPAVCRALTELRTVVNHVIKTYGMPTMIRLEMARDLKRPRKQREQAWKRNRDRQSERQVAAAKIKAAKLVVGEPNRDAIEKWLLADECNWLCPYTGKTISAEALLGPHPQFDVEHIVPFSISLDNTFINKTLCDSHFNRHRKANKLPTACYDPDGQEWQDTLSRVRRFRGQASSIKLERFQWTEVPDGFTNRDLQDTRYASRLAGEYLALLYGGMVDADGKRCIQVSAGGVTAKLRDVWGMNGILNDGGIKTRDDHRHHAVDAVAIALTSPATVKMLSEAATKAHSAGRHRFAPANEPWPDFIDDLRDAIDSINVSHRADRRISGPLHAETNYSRPISAPGGKLVTRKRVRLDQLTVKNIESDAIVDPSVRDAVRTKWHALGRGNPKQIFVDRINHPYMQTQDGRIIPIHKVRITVNDKPRQIGSGTRKRYVISGKDSLHHTVIVSSQLKNGEKWRDEPVDRMEMHRRLSASPCVPMIQTDWGTDRFVMALCKGDCIEMNDKNHNRSLFIVRSISKADITIRLHTDARTDEQIKLAGERSKYRIRSADELRKRRAVRVVVGPLGDIHRVKIGHV